METLENSKFQPIGGLDDLITQKAVLKKFAWLTAQTLTGWRVSGVVRAIKTKDRQFVYPLTDLVEAANRELQTWEENAQGDSGNSESNGSPPTQTDPVSIETGMMSEQEELSVENSRQLIFGRQKKSLLPSSQRQKSQPKLQKA